MTHAEAVTLLPVYALGALDEDAAVLEAHLQTCAECTALLASYRETTATLGEAVERVAPPDRLRAAVLARAPAPPIPRRLALAWLPVVRRLAMPAVAALLILAVGFAAGNVAQRRQLDAAQQELAIDEQGLALLTSTETTEYRLTPVTDPNGPEHGHWYHRPGIATQVLVIEMMPSPPVGEGYVGWLRHANGSWQRVGHFSPDEHGYGRLILTGGDGADVQQVIVTRQATETTAPAGVVVLRWTGQ